MWQSPLVCNNFIDFWIVSIKCASKVTFCPRDLIKISLIVDQIDSGDNTKIISPKWGGGLFIVLLVTISSQFFAVFACVFYPKKTR